jgi:hypothetical protein
VEGSSDLRLVAVPALRPGRPSADGKERKVDSIAAGT